MMACRCLVGSRCQECDSELVVGNKRPWLERERNPSSTWNERNVRNGGAAKVATRRGWSGGRASPFFL